MEWEKLFRRYDWNDRTTPYLTPSDKLNPDQAKSEDLFYCLFHAILFGVITIAALGGSDAQSMVVAYYSFSVVCAAVLFMMMKSYPAALYLSATPLVAIVYVLIFRYGSGAGSIDTIFVLCVLALFLRYSFRIVSVARNYPDLPPAED